MTSVYKNESGDANKKCKEMKKFFIRILVFKFAEFWDEMRNRGLKIGGILVASTYTSILIFFN